MPPAGIRFELKDSFNDPFSPQEMIRIPFEVGAAYNVRMVSYDSVSNSGMRLELATHYQAWP